MEFIDLRSDTVTRPSPGMREAIAGAAVGDDVFRDDPTVKRLEEITANLLGKEAALFVPSGTMGNAICIKILTDPGDEVIVEKNSHIFNYEGAGAARISGVQLHPVQGHRGMIPISIAETLIRPADPHFPRTKVIALENTHNREGGVILPLHEIKKMRMFTESKGILMHLDGARLWNASVGSGIKVLEYAENFDTVLVCYSKGLGAPVGSAISGCKSLIEKARFVRKYLGGGMRQVGILAAAAIYAIENNIERLKIDHESAREIGTRLNEINGISVDLTKLDTNIIIINIEKPGLNSLTLVEQLKTHGILVVPFGFDKLRAVTHLDMTVKDIPVIINSFKEVFSGN